MKVSVIIPAHNPNMNFLETALESAFDQTVKPHEVIVVDDCSDSKVMISKNFRDKGLKLLRTSGNLGPAGARNFGIKHSEGELISFLDADDIWSLYKLEHSLKEFEKEPTIGMTCGNYQFLIKGRIGRAFYRSPISIDRTALMRANYVASGSVTMRRDIFDEVGGFNEDYWIAEDFDLWLKCSEVSKIKYIHKPLYYYRIQGKGMSLTQRIDIQKEHLPNIERIKKESAERIRGRLAIG